jgi:L,D-transpeptidase YbiS
MQTPACENWLRVSIAAQTLELRDGAGELLRSFPVSTSRFGLGTELGSFRTPLGRFRIGARIGAGAELGAIFKSRIPTGGNGLESPEEDLVLTRILWLEGAEPRNANTWQRYIYIHGTNHEDALGRPASHGCVRMKNADIAELFEMAPEGMEVRIEEV